MLLGRGRVSSRGGQRKPTTNNCNSENECVSYKAQGLHVSIKEIIDLPSRQLAMGEYFATDYETFP